jgi:hypothetical protein
MSAVSSSRNPGEAALRALVDAHFDFIWRLFRRMGLSHADADDAAQHVFITATEKFDVIALGSERTFLYGVALRVLRARQSQGSLGAGGALRWRISEQPARGSRQKVSSHAWCWWEPQRMRISGSKLMRYRIQIGSPVMAPVLLLAACGGKLDVGGSGGTGGRSSAGTAGSEEAAGAGAIRVVLEN